MPDAPAEVVIQDLSKSFDGKVVLSHINLTIPRGEMVAIVGGSGCGKTVLLKHITGHFRPDTGRALVADHEVDPGPDGAAPLRDIATLDDLALDAIRVHWAIVFQRNALVTGTVYENLAMLPREVKQMTDAQIRPIARKALQDVGLDPDEVMQRDREDLSGGMAKRVAIARALVMDPAIIFYDEPTSGLDPEHAALLHELIASTHARPTEQQLRRTSVIITHDTALLARVRPRIVMLYKGKVSFDGTFDDFASSDSPEIRPYFEQMGFLHGTHESGRRTR